MENWSCNQSLKKKLDVISQQLQIVEERVHREDLLLEEIKSHFLKLWNDSLKKVGEITHDFDVSSKQKYVLLVSKVFEIKQAKVKRSLKVKQFDTIFSKPLYLPICNFGKDLTSRGEHEEEEEEEVKWASGVHLSQSVSKGT